MSEFKLSIKSDLKDLTAHLSRIQRQQIPFASALAITKTAQDVRTDLYQNMLKVFDAPVAYAVPRNIKEPKQRGSLYLVKATKKNLEAEVYVKNMTFGKGTPWSFTHLENLRLFNLDRHAIERLGKQTNTAKRHVSQSTSNSNCHPFNLRLCAQSPRRN